MTTTEDPLAPEDQSAPEDVVAAWAGPPSPPTDGPLTLQELQLAGRNRGMPLEAMRYDITPTGLHYLLVHFDIPAVDPVTWRLRLGGLVDNPIELSLEDLRARPSHTIPVTLECAGNGRARLSPRPLSNPWLFEAVGTAEWTGTPLGPLLDEAGLRDDAVELIFTGADRGIQGGTEHDFQRSLSIAEARRPEVLLAYAMNGAPLQPQHGFPVRLVVPGWYGMASVKWLRQIDAVSEPFQGYQQARTYRFKADAADPGEPVSRIRVRALMAPPGIPDYFTRRRLVTAGQVSLTGRAWGGRTPLDRVEVGVDGDWVDAVLGPSMGDFAWRPWSFEWNARPGKHLLACRATDADGERQPLSAPWNYQGMGNNSVQSIAVTVR
ncbi:MAG TPA: sulfite oxidase [Candidatus Limnocylindrales bacterium]|nr:sulfite oxidase [Candidatus Limnocylindrales bacterium]